MSSVGGEQLGFLGTMIKLLKEYGLAKILLAICVIAMLVWALNSEDTVNKVINRALDQKSEIHIQEEINAIDNRMSAQSTVQDILRDVMDDTGADRVYIFEMHNGTNNTSGFPFVYAEMTYEICRHNIDYVADEYNKMLLTRYTITTIVHDTGYWSGTVDDMMNVDRRFGLKMSANYVNYISLIRLTGVHRGNTIGILGVSYVKTDRPDDYDKAKSSMIAASQKLSIILDTVDISSNYNGYNDEDY